MENQCACPECQITFDTRVQLENHVGLHEFQTLGVLRYPVTVYGDSDPCDILDVPELIYDQFVCTHCGCCIDTVVNASIHQRLHASALNRRFIPYGLPGVVRSDGIHCTICNASFQCNSTFYEHLHATHVMCEPVFTDIHACTYCGARVPTDMQTLHLNHCRASYNDCVSALNREAVIEFLAHHRHCRSTGTGLLSTIDDAIAIQIVSFSILN